MHPLLERQLRKQRLTPESPPEGSAWREILALVDQAYESSDEDRYIVERSMVVSSAEMRQLMDQLENRNKELSWEIDKHAKTAAMLRYSATHDELTGLPSRMVLLERLRACIERHRCSDSYQYAVLFADLDEFKLINDSLGHDIGDEVLIEVGRRLMAASESVGSREPLVARIGGDEFVIVLEDIGSERQAIGVAENVSRSLASPFSLARRKLSVRASVGISFGSNGYREAGTILRDADTAMYRAKKAGKSCYTIFDSQMHADVVARLTIEQELRASIARQDFVLHYQPLISLTDGRIRGFEALARWNHPERGLLAPSEFIDAAEETGLIVPLGDLLTKRAFCDLAEWKRRTGCDTTVAINISKRQLIADHFERAFVEAARDAGVSPSSAVIEITETTATSDHDKVFDVLARLRQIGVKIHMDDFGTGYSSLSAIHQMPFDAIKIDRSFTSRIENQRRHAAIVMAIIMLAHNLGLEVIAEGIETPEQLAFLQSCDCDMGQGYYFAKPIETAAVCRLLPAGGGSAFPMDLAA